MVEDLPLIQMVRRGLVAGQLKRALEHRQKDRREQLVRGRRVPARFRPGGKKERESVTERERRRGEGRERKRKREI